MNTRTIFASCHAELRAADTVDGVANNKVTDRLRTTITKANASKRQGGKVYNNEPLYAAKRVVIEKRPRR